MSTKIFHGWRVDDITLEHLLARLKRFRKSVVTKAQELVSRYAIARCVDVIDSAAMNGCRVQWESESVDDLLKTAFDADVSLFRYMAIAADAAVHKSFKTTQRGDLDIQCSVTCHPIDGV